MNYNNFYKYATQTYVIAAFSLIFATIGIFGIPAMTTAEEDIAVESASTTIDRTTDEIPLDLSELTVGEYIELFNNNEDQEEKTAKITVSFKY